jgi:hypothetical protein
MLRREAGSGTEDINGESDKGSGHRGLEVAVKVMSVGSPHKAA